MAPDPRIEAYIRGILSVATRMIVNKKIMTEAV
jgi:hypothetical protein